MLKQPNRSILRMLAGVFLVSAAPFALAGGHPEVNWSVNIGSGYPAPRIYAPAPAVVYVQPQPVYYVQPAAVVSYGYPYYADGHHHKHKHKNKHHWKHHHGY